MTVNVPESFIDAIEKLVGEGENALFPSRSELIRVAVREFLLKEMKMAKSMAKHNNKNIEDLTDDFDKENFVQIPIENKDEKEPIRKFKTYKILRRLENSDPISESGNLIEDNIDEDDDDDYDDDYDDDETKKYLKPDYNKSEEYKKPTLEQLRKLYPNRVDLKFINEGDRGSLLNI